MTLRSLLKILMWSCLLGVIATQGSAQTVVSVTQIKYDENDRPTCTAIRMNPATFSTITVTTDPCALLAENGAYGPDRITKNVYDAAGQLTEIRRGVGTPLEQPYARYWYYPNGTKRYEINANSYTTQFDYDGFDRLARVYYPCPNTLNCANGNDYEEYGYDANGNRTSWRRRDGNTIGYGYDKLNRQTSKGGAAVADVAMTYDLLGNVKSKVFATGGQGVTYTYDGLSRITSTTDMNGRTVSYVYNSAGARISLIHPDLNTVGYGLDNANRMTSLGWNATSGLLTQSYDNLGRLSGQGKVGGSTNYGYDGIGRLTSMTNNLANTANDVTWTFVYNPAGQVWSSDATSTVYDYKELSNAIVNKTHDGLNRDTGIVSVGGYDAKGNLTYEGTGGRTMTYDIENRLVSVVGPSVNMRLNYDPEGRLYRYSTDGGSTWTTFLYDGVNLIAEYSGGTSTTPLRRYIHGTGTDNPLLWLEGSDVSDKRWLYTNHQGSVITYTGESGTPGAIFKYGPYGEPKDINNNENWSSLRFRYTGQVTLPAAKLYYYKARVYDPVYGRFLQTDPIGSKDDLNLYAYVGGDPVNNGDPDGQQTMPSYVTNRYAENQEACGGDSGCTQRLNRQQDVAGAGMVLTGMVGVAVAACATFPVCAVAMLPSDIEDGGYSGPVAGGGAKLANLAPEDITRIQNAANRTNTEITVVGSRAAGTPKPNSDWDYVVPPDTKKKTVHSLSSSVPEGPRGLGEPRNSDFFRENVDQEKPYITFKPEPTN
jgi:RHS repeat-associated protein